MVSKGRFRKVAALVFSEADPRRLASLVAIQYSPQSHRTDAIAPISSGLDVDEPLLRCPIAQADQQALAFKRVHADNMVRRIAD